MTEAIFIDDGENADWIKGRTWEFESEVEAFLLEIGGARRVEHFMALPAARAMPEGLRQALVDQHFVKSATDLEGVVIEGDRSGTVHVRGVRSSDQGVAGRLAEGSVRRIPRRRTAGHHFVAGRSSGAVPRRSRAVVRAGLDEASAVRLTEHPGHTTGTGQNVHGRRGSSGTLGMGSSPVGKHALRRVRPGGAGVFGREAPDWQNQMRKGETTRVFGTSSEKRMAEGPITSPFDDSTSGEGTTVSGQMEIDGRLVYVKPENGYFEGSGNFSDTGTRAPRVSEGGETMIPAGSEPERELAFHYIDKALGGISNAPDVVLRTGLFEGTGVRTTEQGPWQGSTFVMDKKTRWVVSQSASERIPPGSKVLRQDDIQLEDLPARDRRRLALVDSLTGNTDRHPGNFISYEDAKGVPHVVPIDHGLSFPRRAGWGNYQSQMDSHRLGKAEKAVVDRLYKNRAKVRRDLKAILNDDVAVDGFFARLDFVRRMGRTISIFDYNKIVSGGLGETAGDWTRLSAIW